jgi:hypothetical protein
VREYLNFRITEFGTARRGDCCARIFRSVPVGGRRKERAEVDANYRKFFS